MANIIEESKSNRAACRTCKLKIEKGVLRFGEETPNTFNPEGGSAYFWHHMTCAAGRMPDKVKAAMAAFAGTIPDRVAIEAILANPPKKRGGATANYPYAERASTSRSKCMSCEEAIEKDTLRVAVEREVDTGSFTSKGPGYLHPACASEFSGDAALLEKIKANSSALTPDDVLVLEAEF